MATTVNTPIGERIAALADTDLSARPAEVWAVALEAERAGVAAGIVDALLDVSSPSVVRERALAMVSARLVLSVPSAPVSEVDIRRAMTAAGLQYA